MLEAVAKCLAPVLSAFWDIPLQSWALFKIHKVKRENASFLYNFE